MCYRIVSTFERCGHQDTIAHIKLCVSALSSWPSVPCPLAPGQVDPPLYDIPTLCPTCTLHRAVLTPSGHMRESTSSTNIAHKVPGPGMAEKIKDVGALKQSTDTVLEWKDHAVDTAFAGAGGGEWDAGVGGGEWVGDASTVVTYANDGGSTPGFDRGSMSEFTNVAESWADDVEKHEMEYGRGEEAAMQW